MSLVPDMAKLDGLTMSMVLPVLQTDNISIVFAMSVVHAVLCDEQKLCFRPVAQNTMLNMSNVIGHFFFRMTTLIYVHSQLLTFWVIYFKELASI